ncbi:MAG: acyl-CoA dehydrogenase family protein, partial [Acidimicrobiales bacterium]
MTDTVLTAERLALVQRVAELGPTFAERAVGYDRDAAFPAQNWEDLEAAGLLAVCIPESAGGLGGDFVAYALVAEELGRHCASTALTFNMHVATTLLVGQIADDLDHDDDERELLESRRERL